MTKDKGQKTKDKRQKTKDKRQETMRLDNKILRYQEIRTLFNLQVLSYGRNS
jgi:hypothetical protein